MLQAHTVRAQIDVHDCVQRMRFLRVRTRAHRQTEREAVISIGEHEN